MADQERSKNPAEPAANTRLDQRKKPEEKRCESCNHLLMNHKIVSGVAEIKCSKCGHINRVEIGLEYK